MAKKAGKRPYIFLIIIAGVALLAFFYLRRDQVIFSMDFLKTGKPAISQALSCKLQHADSSVLTARKDKTDAIKLLVSFNEEPSQDMRDYLAHQGITIYLNTWVADYRLCFLDTIPGVTKISLGEV